MSSLAQQLQQALNSHRPMAPVPEVIEFRCGKMKLEANGTTVQPDLRKGRITVRTADTDGCLHFTWTERNSNTAEPEDDLILFPGDATFGRVEAARNNAKNNRVFALKFTATKKVHFFWMQEPNKDKDEDLVRKINVKINGADAESPAPGAAVSNVHQMDQASLLALFEGVQGATSAGAGAAAASPAAGSAPSTSDAAMQDTQAAPAAGAASSGQTAAAEPKPEGGGQPAGGADQMDVDGAAGGDKPAPN